MKTNQRGIKKIICLFIAMLLFLLSVLPVAASGNKRVLKIGYIDYDGFFSETKDGTYSGYAIAYLDEIAKYTNYQYDFVECSWEDSLTKLKNHEIDLVCISKYNETRAQEYSYALQSIGTSKNVIYTREDNQDICYEDYQNMNGKKIAFLKGSLLIDKFKAYAQKHQFSYEAILYDRDAAMEKALTSGEVSMMVTDNMARRDNLKLIGEFGSEQYYLMSYKNSPYIDEINAALSEISLHDLDFSNKLFQKYYGDSKAECDTHFTREEMEYIKNAPTFSVAVGTVGKPIAYQAKDGTLCGITPAILEQISKNSGLKFTLVPLNEGSEKYNYEYFRKNKISLIAGIDVNGFNQNLDGLSLTNAYFTSQKALVTRQGEFVSENSKCKIAVIGSSTVSQYAIKKNFPNFEIVSFSSLEECLNAVRDQKADVMLYNQYLLDTALARPQYDSLCIVPSIHLSESLALSSVVYADEAGVENETLSSPYLISILNKSIHAITPATQNDIIVDNTVAQDNSLSLGDLLYKYRVLVSIVAILLIICASLFVIVAKNRKRTLKSIREKNIQLATLFLKRNMPIKQKASFYRI